MLLSRDPDFSVLIFILIVPIHNICSALACACYFLLRKKKVTKEISPKQPALRETSDSGFANASVQLPSLLDEPQFAVHGELTLPTPKSEAGCTGWEMQMSTIDPLQSFVYPESGLSAVLYMVAQLFNRPFLNEL
jgi:hypothetical protein